MKKVLSTIFVILVVIFVVVLGILLVVKIKNDTLAQKQKEELNENIRIEAEYFSNNAMKTIEDIKSKIEKDIGKKVELAETGNLDKIDICFAVKDGDTYTYVVEKYIDGVQKFELAQDESEEAQYILEIDTLGIKDCVYTNIKNYNIDRDGKIIYINN